MFGFTKENKFCEYREIKTKEEAKKYQAEKYGDYCKQYINKTKVMFNYKYRMSEMGYYMEGYLGNTYSYINAYMRNEETNNERYNVLIDRLNELILCAPQIEEDIVVYRGVSQNTMNIIMAQSKEYDGNYIEKAFMSTSLRLETVISEFPSYDCIMKIYVSKGAFALGVDGIKDRDEEEMLFPEKQWLKFIDKKKNKETGKYIYEFELVNHYHAISSD